MTALRLPMDRQITPLDLGSLEREKQQIDGQVKELLESRDTEELGKANGV